MTVREIQHVGLDMMKVIHLFCIDNNIRYTLAYGSLIGAVRHHGFIPWDDDIDLWMPRPDYERFCRTFQSKDGIKIMSSYSDDNYLYFTKVYDDTRTHVEMKLLHQKGDIGVWIDVFPIDGVSDIKGRFLMDYRHMCNIRKKLNSIRGSYTEIVKAKGLKKKKAFLKLWIKNILFGSVHKLRAKHQRLCSVYQFGTTQHCSSLCCVDAYKKRKPECFDTVDFYDYMLTEFEGEQFYITKSFDKILKHIYGDYMILPPKEKQESHLTKDGERFYWKY